MSLTIRLDLLQLHRPIVFLCTSRLSIAGELLFERWHHNRTPIAEANIESHASDPDFFVGFGPEAAEGWRVKGVIFVIKTDQCTESRASVHSTPPVTNRSS